MTLKNLFFKLQLEDLKRRIWSIALFTIVFVIILPIINALNINNLKGEPSERIINRVIQTIGPNYPALIFMTVIFAIVSGLSGFFYLHSRKKVDLYHSIPARRELLFFTSYINGFLIFFIPYLINVILSLIILKANNYLYAEVFTAAMIGIVIHTVYFCLIYSLTIIAVMLTGNLIISFCGISVFLFYTPAIRLIKDEYFGSFFLTYFSNGDKNVNTSFLSPLESYYNVVSLYVEGNKSNMSIVLTMLVTIALIGIALFLYKKRPSEAAGKSMAFQISKVMIKFLIVIPISLGGGMMLRNFVSNGNDAWYMFGLVFCFIIVYALIQVMFEFDMRSAFLHKKQMLICLAITGVISIIFRFDIFGYDNYIPKENEIESMSVAIPGLDQNLDYRQLNNREARYISSLNYQLKNMKLTDFNSAYELVKLCLASETKGNVRNDYNSYVYNYNVFNYYVKYTLKNGKEIYRSYGIDVDVCMNYLSDIYSNEAYKKAHYPIFQWKDSEVDQVYVSYGNEILNYKSAGLEAKENVSFSLSGNSVKELSQIYKEELGNLTIEEVANEMPMIELAFIMNHIRFYNYYVYPSFVKTIEFLENHGFDTTVTINPENITEITINNYGAVQYITKNVTPDGIDQIATTESFEPLSYTDRKDILEIWPSLIQSDYSHEYNLVIDTEDIIEVNIIYKLDGNGLSQSFSYRFLKDKIPAKVKDDMRLYGRVE